MYQCKACGAKVELKDGVIHRDCEHHGEGVTASASAVMVGKSRTSGEKDDARVQ